MPFQFALQPLTADSGADEGSTPPPPETSEAGASAATAKPVFAEPTGTGKKVVGPLTPIGSVVSLRTGSQIILGRGALLGIQDKRCSRKQATLDLLPVSGTARFTVQGTNSSRLKRAGSQTWEKVKTGDSVEIDVDDVIALTGKKHFFRLVVRDDRGDPKTRGSVADGAGTGAGRIRFSDSVEAMPAKDGDDGDDEDVPEVSTPPTVFPDVDAAATRTHTEPMNEADVAESTGAKGSEGEPTAMAADPPVTTSTSDAAPPAAAAAAVAAAAAAPSEPKGKSSRFDDFLAGAAELTADTRDEAETLAPEDTPGIDIVFSLDTTGSMYVYLERIREVVRQTVTDLLAKVPDIHIGIIVHGDYGDQTINYVIRSLDLTGDVDEIVNFLDSVQKTNGQDAAECYELALREARNLSWREDKAKALVVIGDDVPHQPSFTDAAINWRHELVALTDAGVQIFAAQCTTDKRKAPFYEEMAELSGGFLLHVESLDWMPIMFYGACLRQASPSAFESYRMELIWTKKLTHESPLNTLFMEMTTPVITKLDPNYTKHQTAKWWDPEVTDDADAVPRYYYHKATNRWEKKPEHGKKPKRKTKKKTKKRAASDSGSGSGSAGAAPPKKRTKRAPKAPPPALKTIAAVDALDKKAPVRAQLMLRKKKPITDYDEPVVVGGGANDGIAEMKVRLKRLIQQEIDDGKHAEEVADYE